MKKYIPIFIVFFIFCQSCNTWRSNLLIHGNYEAAIKNAIIDFSNTSSLVKKDSTFSVNFVNIDTDLLGVSIYGSVGKFIVTKKNGKTSKLPTRYFEYKGNLFYWYDKNFPLENSIVFKLSKYNLIDSVETIADAIFVIDDAKMGIDYYFCKNNLANYKKVISNKEIGYYNPPKLKCNK